MKELKTIEEVRKNHKHYQQLKDRGVLYSVESCFPFTEEGEEEKFEDILWEWCSDEGDEETRLSTLKSVRDDKTISDEFYERFCSSWINNMDTLLEEGQTW